MRRILIWILLVSIAVLVVQSLFIILLMGDARKKAQQLHNQLATVAREVQEDFRQKCTVDDALPAVKLKESIDAVKELEERLAICDRANDIARASEQQVTALVESSSQLASDLESVPDDAEAARAAAERAREILPPDPAWFGSLAAAVQALSACDGDGELCDQEGRLALARALEHLRQATRATRLVVTGQDQPEAVLHGKLDALDGTIKKTLEQAARDLASAVNAPALARDWLRDYARRSRDTVSARLDGRRLRIAIGHPAPPGPEAAPALTCEDFAVAVGAYQQPQSPALWQNVALSGNLLVAHRGPAKATVLFNHRPLFGVAIQKSLATAGEQCVAEISLTESEADLLARGSGRNRLRVEISMPASAPIEVAYRVASGS